MRVGTGIENNSVVTESYFLQLIDELALDIALVILYLDIGIFSLQLWKVTSERIVAVNTRLANTKQIEAGAIDNLYLHS